MGDEAGMTVTDSISRPVSGGMRYAHRLSTRSRTHETKETGSEEDFHRNGTSDRQGAGFTSGDTTSSKYRWSGFVQRKSKPMRDKGSESGTRRDRNILYWQCSNVLNTFLMNRGTPLPMAHGTFFASQTLPNCGVRVEAPLADAS